MSFFVKHVRRLEWRIFRLGVRCRCEPCGGVLPTWCLFSLFCQVSWKVRRIEGGGLRWCFLFCFGFLPRWPCWVNGAEAGCSAPARCCEAGRRVASVSTCCLLPNGPRVLDSSTLSNSRIIIRFHARLAPFPEVTTRCMSCPVLHSAANGQLQCPFCWAAPGWSAKECWHGCDFPRPRAVWVSVCGPGSPLRRRGGQA